MISVLKDSIDIPIVCIRCKKYGHHVTDCRKEEKAKKEKIKIKQDKKLITLQELVTEAKTIKQEIKEIKKNNSTDINEHNITEIINLNEHSKPMIDPPSLEEDILDNANNKQNILSSIDSIIFQKWYTDITLLINKEFSLT